MSSDDHSIGNVMCDSVWVVIYLFDCIAKLLDILIEVCLRLSGCVVAPIFGPVQWVSRSSNKMVVFIRCIAEAALLRRIKMSTGFEVGGKPTIKKPM